MVDDLVPHAHFVVVLFHGGHVVQVNVEEFLEVRTVFRQVAQAQGQPESRESITSPPRRVFRVQRRVLMQTVLADVQFEHEVQMPRGHVDVLRLTGQPTGLNKNRRAHEYGIAHFTVIRH